jgi:hypothetical protein
LIQFIAIVEAECANLAFKCCERPGLYVGLATWACGCNRASYTTAPKKQENSTAWDDIIILHTHWLCCQTSLKPGSVPCQSGPYAKAPKQLW